MKRKLGMELRPTLEVQQICTCCEQPYYLNKRRQDQIEAIVCGAEKYAICPLCTQAVPATVVRNEGYRQRCQHEVARLRRLFESECTTPKREVKPVAEPTYEELKAKIAALESKQQRESSISFKPTFPF